MGDGCKDVGLVGVSKEETSRVKLTEVNPHLVCVLCHGYFVDATTITECLHSFCRSCIFRHLETKSFCPICQVQVHARLHRSLKPDKTLQDIVYKLVPGLFHNEMERRRAFYKQHPYRDEHLEPERRGLGLDRLIYSPTDTISLSLEFYDTEREREEWSSVTCPPPHQDSPSPSPSSSTSNNNNKRYLQCPAIFKMAHLKKFLRQKYNLPRTANVEIIYKREFLPDSYALMDVAYIYTWKRNGPMRFYYRIPDVIEKELPFDGKYNQDKQEKTKSSIKAIPENSRLPSSSPKSDLERNKQVLSAAKLAVETVEKKSPTPVLKPVVENNPFTSSLNSRKPKPVPSAPVKTAAVSNSVTENCEPERVDLKNDSPSLEQPKEKKIAVDKVGESQNSVPPNTKSPMVSTNSNKIFNKETTPNEVKSDDNKISTSNLNLPKISKQDELPVEVLLSLSTCRVAKETASADSTNNSAGVPENNQTSSANLVQASKGKHTSNARMSLNKIASELQQKAANNFIQKVSKENSVSPTKTALGKVVSPNSKTPCANKINNVSNNLNGRLNGNKRKNNVNLGQTRHFLNDMGVMDHRIQQLYKYPGSPVSGNGVVQVGQKTESRLASWLNNRFQSKPPTSPSHPGISSPAPALSNSISSHLTMSPKLNGSKPSESLPTSNMNSSLQNAINATIKNSTHLNIPSQVGSHKKIDKTNSSLIQSQVSPGKTNFGEKREKSKSGNFINSVHSKKEPEILKEALTKSALLLSQKNGSSSPIRVNPASPKVEENSNKKESLSNQSATNYVKDQGLVIPEVIVPRYVAKEKPVSVFTPPSAVTNKSPKAVPAKEAAATNGDVPIKTSSVTVNGSDVATKPSELKQDDNKKQVDSKGDSSKLDEEVNRLKRKLEEMRKMSNAKGKELGGCQITHENPDPEEAKRRRDITPVVSIELMRGCKRPVPGLKAIQDMVDLGKRKTLDEKKDHPEKKPKLTTIKKEVSKKEDSCALDLSRCGPPNPTTPPHPWFNPLLHQQFLPSPK